MKHVFDVHTRASVYPIFCGNRPESHISGIWDTHWHRAAVIADGNTARFAQKIASALRSDGIWVCEETFAPGEASKTREVKACIEDRLLDAGLARNGCVVAVGGGVTLDLAGFVAATYMRGIPHINVATSLLAQVDASIGGKTGVNTPQGKNLVGAFHHPRAVYLDTGALSTLPRRELACGMAELVKHAVLGDAGLLDEIAALAGNFDIEALTPLIARGAEIKAQVVAQDENEAGLRRILNFGHTVGHGIERATNYRVRHGEAVAAGMVVEATIAHQMTGFPAEQVRFLANTLAEWGLPTRPPVPFQEIALHMRYDKKATERWRFALPKSIGDMERAGGDWVVEVGAAQAAASFDFVSSALV